MAPLMSLAQQLREQAVGKFRHCYLRYQALLAQLHAEASPAAGGWRAPLLRRHLQEVASGTSSGDSAEQLAAAFGSVAHNYAQEVARLRLFLKSSLEALWLALLDGCGQLRGLGEELLQGGAAAGGPAHQQLHARLAALKAGFDATADELVLLERFLRQNVAACGQLAQMHDRQQQWAGTASELPLAEVEGSYLAAAQGALLGELRLEPLLLGLSDAYEQCRLIESDAAALAGRPAQWVPPDKFQRVTRKFWLHPADVMRFKAEVIRNLPVLIFGDRQKLTEASPFEVAFLRDQGAATDSADVHSVYYDNPTSMPSYQARLRKDDHASVARLRWYGDRAAGSPDQRIFVERKVHRERYTGERSYKERAPIAQRHVADFTSGMGAPPEMLEGPHAEFLRDAQMFLVQGAQVPMVRTCYLRTAFQEASNNLVRISLDTQLHMVREEGAPRAPGDWCRDMGAPLPPQDASYFPYAVVEIKLQEAPSSWVQGLLSTGMLLPVPKFSKFLHGAALLYQHRCLNVPYWFLPDEHDPRLMSPATWEEMADPADEFLQKGAAWLFPKAAGGQDGEEGDEAADEAVVPYSPSPLRFLHRNKTVPVIGSSSGAVAAAAVRTPAAHTAACPPAWESLQVAGGARGATSQQQQQQQHAIQGGAPAAAYAAPAGSALVHAAAAAHVSANQPRNYTWPVYQNPLELLPPPRAMPVPTITAQPQQLQRSSTAVAVVAATTRPGSPRSQSQSSGTPHDSAQDLEAGQQAAAECELKSPQCSSGGNSSRQQRPGVAGKAAGQPGAPCFAALQYRLPGAPAGGNGSGPGAEAPCGRAKALVRTRVEPKTFFANERTFLQWLQISVLIMMTATSLLSGSGLVSTMTGGGSGGTTGCQPGDKGCFASKLSGAIIAPVALIFMAYALFMYKKRTYQILARETVRYDDQRGPVVLVVILLIVFALAYILALLWIF